ncbi:MULTISPECIES: TadE/TadG family type IV pilus assembly protein [Sphingopyxis]|uniref:TadE/TadG family type IV pilus assembly protein n=1 Tax=Sphingopyxis TaxID=165697 RepID=UPI0015CBD2E9|nr:MULTISPECIES: TadE/TadG family type IV pilus assembly protein [Sphingopyxis]NYF33108.1 Flp pilus assembly protein TadG [Sphingopyxis sp. JAI108]
MRGTWIGRLRAGTKSLISDQRGNAFMLTAAAIVPVIGIVGSAVDIGRAYMTQLRLQQACDAGVLAGRRAMGGASYSEAAQSEANKMFNFNFPEAKYGASGILFSSQALNASDVAGQASAVLPTELMFMFGKDQFRLSANCTAKLEISNVDVMMVLDVTGSMAQTNSGDSVDRITALKDATMDFFDTLTTADIGDGRLRFGVVPYSSTANVGAILSAENPAWLANNVTLPSRTPIFREVYTETGTETSDEYTDSATTYDSSWTNDGTVSASSSSACESRTPPANTTPSPSGSPDYNQTGQYVDGDTRVTTYDKEQTYTFRTYRYSWRSSNSTCRKQYRKGYFTRTYETTVTETKTDVFDNRYTYEDRDFDVSLAKTGAAIVTDTGDSGTSVSYTWGGCLIERATAEFDSDETAPSDALDMDIDLVPDADVDTQWRLLIPEIAFARASHPANQPASSDPITVNEFNSNGSRNITLDTSSKGRWQRYSKYWGDGWGVCPAPAMKLTTMTADNRSTFNTYVQSLQPLGGTYHDAGMIWGARLLSPTGLFADENATAPNERPISRHIVFMTDGAMAPNMGNLTFQGYEYLMHRVGGTTDGELRDHHNNRFQQLCRAARQRGITIWVVSFGIGSDASLNSCASSGAAFEADNAAELNEQFQAIARQISKLRLSQ